MKHETIFYKGFIITQRIDVKSHCATIYNGNDIVKMIAGDIFADGSNNAIEKAKKFIDK